MCNGKRETRPHTRAREGYIFVLSAYPPDLEILKSPRFLTCDMSKLGKESLNVLSTLGASNHSQGQRQPEDFYASPAVVIDELLRGYPELPTTIWEPCCGTGNLSERLSQFGFSVYSSDLFDRGYGQTGIDFLQTTSMPPDCNCIVSNFPFKLILPMTLHALNLLRVGGVLCSFGRLNLLEGKNRYEQIYHDNPPKYILQFVKRIECGKDGHFTGKSAVSYAWFIWEKGFNGNPLVKWVNY